MLEIFPPENKCWNTLYSLSTLELSLSPPFEPFVIFFLTLSHVWKWKIKISYLLEYLFEKLYKYMKYSRVKTSNELKIFLKYEPLCNFCVADDSI